MFNSIGWGELLLLLAVGLIVLGPERLPKYAADAVKLIRQLREISTNLTADLREQLGPELTSLTSTTSTSAQTATPTTSGYQHVPRHPMFDDPPTPVPAPTPPSKSSSPTAPPPAPPVCDDQHPQPRDA